MALTIISAPAVTPVSLAEAKANLNVDHTDDDTLIQLMIEAATAHCDGPVGFLGRALVSQQWQLTLDEFPENEIKIPLPPLIAVDSIQYDDVDGAEQTVDPLTYTVDLTSEPGWILPEDTWPATFDGINAVRVVFTAGYPYDSNSPAVPQVPSDIKAAILLFVGSLYANRENEIVGASVATLPWAAEQLLRRRRHDLSMA